MTFYLNNVKTKREREGAGQAGAPQVWAEQLILSLPVGQIMPNTVLQGVSK